ncbi:MAG: transglycosylase SLT domain-containing protein [Steroidobacteraceae bacterium]
MRFLASLSLALMLCCTFARAAEPQLLVPPELQPDVQFWIRVYSEISTNEGFIHDQHNLAVIYETVRFAPDLSPKEREARVDEVRERYQLILEHLASGAAPQDADEQRVAMLWGAEGNPARFEQARVDVRFQLGQSDRFRAGLQRSGAWETKIAETLANLGLPAELAALPHVESSFDPQARSKAGAFGLWQFMGSTGRRFLRIDRVVDERLDPFRSTEAAAQLLAYNYRVLGTWPLAITAYNHGAEGMRRAREQMGSDDIVRIVRSYQSPTFGFASRNFYVSFLAALAIDQNPEKYFGPIERSAEQNFQELPLAAATSAAALGKLAHVDTETLKALNPAIRPPVWSGQLPLPRGYRLRLPVAATTPKAEQLAALAQENPPAPAAAASAAATESTQYVVGRGDTLSSISARTKLSAEQLMRFNGLHDPDHIYEGQRLQLVAQAAAQSGLPNGETAEVIIEEVRQETTAVASASAHTEPVSAAQQNSQSPTLVPGAEPAASADSTDYSVSESGTIIIAAAETLGHYADWLGVSAARLRRLNGLTDRATLAIGRHLKLEFKTVTREQFEERRRDYHLQLQALYFATHYITGTEIYIARRGDSLWSLTQHGQLPIWLLQQYNPDLDFGELRAGTQVVLPRIEGPG